MRVAGLFVEGKLDSQLLGAVLGLPIVGLAGKRELPSAVRYVERHRTEPLTARLAYVRDRDFDADPPDDPSGPVRVAHGDDVVGWRWCRHEIENYLLEPAIVASALGCNVDEYTGALAAAAKVLCAYAASRWTAGRIRRALPRGYALETKPDHLVGTDFRLPEDLSAAACEDWLRAHTAAFRDRIQAALDADQIAQTLQDYRGRLAAALTASSASLAWFSGKDLMGALDAWLATRQLDPGRFRSTLAQWVREHPEQALLFLPEWRALHDVLRADVGTAAGTEDDA